MATTQQTEEPIVILGAGLAGSLMACFLSQKGYKVELFERNDDMRKVEMSAGRSINLALSQRGLTALSKVGLKEEVLSIAIPMSGRMMHSKEGNLTYQPYSKDSKSAIYSVSRGELNKKFMTLAEQRNGVRIHFNHKCLNVDLNNKTVTIRKPSGEVIHVSGQTILACDGAFSAVRSSLLHTPRFDYSQSFLEHGYKELHIPPNEKGEHQMDKHRLHIWPRGSFMMIALPNLDGSFTVTCFFPYAGENGFDALDSATDDTVLRFFRKDFPDSVPLMPNLLEDWKRNPTSSLVTVRCFPWSIENQCCLFGDAAHAIVPFFGQGMNAAFEDCDVFNQILDNVGNNWNQVFHEFQNARKVNTDAIAHMALENFVEMRDKVADPVFLFQKRVQHLLGIEFQGRFNSRYELVSFSTIPYSEALRLGQIGDHITEELIKDANGDINKIDLNKAKELIEKLLPHSHL